MQILGKTKYGTLEVTTEGCMICWLKQVREDIWSVTGQCQCICGGQWPVVLITLPPQIRPELRDMIIEHGIQRVQLLAEESPPCQDH